MGEDSISRQITREFAQRWRSVNPEGTIISRDLNAIAIPGVEAAGVNANYKPEGSRSADQKDLLRLAGQFARELLNVDEYDGEKDCMLECDEANSPEAPLRYELRPAEQSRRAVCQQ
jgi:hypothetical protein